MNGYCSGPPVWLARGSGHPRLLIVIVSSAALDIPLRRQAQQASMRNEWKLREEYAWILALGTVNEVPIAIAGVHDDALIGNLCRQLASDGGSGRFVLESHEERTMIHDRDLTGQIGRVMRSVSALIVRPMTFHDSTKALLLQVAGLARYKAIVSHPSLRRYPEGFAVVAACCNYCQLDSADAQFFDTTTREHEKLASRARHLLGGDTEFCVINSGGPGLAWVERGWVKIDCPAVQKPDARCAESIFCAAYVVARRFRGAKAKYAVRYAANATASWNGGAPPSRYMA
jgi:hypothetical protein